MVRTRRSTRMEEDGRAGTAGEVGKGYERLREERMRENLERMKRLGILRLSLQLKNHSSTASSSSPPPTPRSRSSIHKPLSIPIRRSSRLQNVTSVSYAELNVKKNENLEINSSVIVEEGKKEEVYTEEHGKLLGTCKMSWTLFKDGYGKDGKRIYDQIKGKSCHQCRQKTLGRHTSCSKCNLVRGQFCGDCLYMRYGENVLEVKKNPKWICPVCRGICNCSRCQTKKGWAPTGHIYKKVLKLGFKSVAHYLIQTHQSEANSGNVNTKKSLPLAGTEDSSQLQTSL